MAHFYMTPMFFCIMYIHYAFKIIAMVKNAKTNTFLRVVYIYDACTWVIFFFSSCNRAWMSSFMGRRALVKFKWWQPFRICFLAIKSLVPGRFGYDFKNTVFTLVLVIGIFRPSYDDALRWMPLGQWQIHIDSGNGLVTSGNKPLAEPILTQFYVIIWCH